MWFLNFIQKPEKNSWKPLKLQENVIFEFYTKTREKIMEASKITKKCNFWILYKNQRKNHGSKMHKLSYNCSLVLTKGQLSPVFLWKYCQLMTLLTNFLVTFLGIILIGSI